MAGPWLYCIAAGSGHVFSFDEQEKTIPVNTDTYAILVEDGRIAEDPWWEISQNWKKVESGDDVFVYTGNDDLGIIGFATIKDVENRNGQWGLCLDFDLPKCKALLRKPIPAPIVRGWIPRPRRNVWNLEPFMKDLYSRVPWKKKR